jgi:hypothetical protein
LISQASTDILEQTQEQRGKIMQARYSEHDERENFKNRYGQEGIVRGGSEGLKQLAVSEMQENSNHGRT